MVLLLVVLPTLAPQLNVVQWLVFPPVEWLLGQFGALTAAVAGG
jgi:hypothetical protein